MYAKGGGRQGNTWKNIKYVKHHLDALIVGNCLTLQPWLWHPWVPSQGKDLKRWVKKIEFHFVY